MTTEKPTSDQAMKAAEEFRTDVKRLTQEIGSVIVGQDEVVEGVITAIIGKGHALLEGVPGLGKTMLVRTLAASIDAEFSRIQFTPDLMPADILGTSVVVEDENRGKHFTFQKGPIFANIVLADEINRATPKTQSALLEAMQDRTISIARKTHQLEQPFFVLATQNPLEMEGTYPLPEAQLDRFFFKLRVEFPNREALHTIVERTTSETSPSAKAVLTKERLVEMQDLVRNVPITRNVADFAIRCLQATHPNTPFASNMAKKYARYGGSPRGAQTIILAAKIRALIEGRYAVSIDDIKHVAPPALRHRILLNFEGEAEGIEPDVIISDILENIPDAV